MTKLIALLLTLGALTAVIAAPEKPVDSKPPKAEEIPQGPRIQPFRTFPGFDGRPAFIIDVRTGEFDHVESPDMTARVLWEMLRAVENICEANINTLKAELADVKAPKKPKAKSTAKKPEEKKAEEAKPEGKG